MSHLKNVILAWSLKGAIPVDDIYQALRLTGVVPSREGWRVFIDRFLLWSGTLLMAAGIIFFFAYNWDAMGRLLKFGIANALIIVSLLLVWRVGLDRVGGKAALLFSTLCVGALLALIGQTYQTGADTFELFAVWAGMIIPWVLVARFPVLWLFWLALTNTALALYFNTFGGLFGLLFSPEQYLWVAFVLNTGALVLWEWLSVRRFIWLRENWANRLIATISGALITTILIFYILDWKSMSTLSFPVWIAWLAGAYYLYRHLVKDVYMLALGVLSVIIIATIFLSKILFANSYNSPGSFLFIGLAVIGLSAAGGWWLKMVVNEDAK